MITNDNNTIIFHHYSVLYVNVIIEIWSFIWLCGPHKIEMNVEGISLFSIDHTAAAWMPLTLYEKTPSITLLGDIYCLNMFVIRPFLQWTELFQFKIHVQVTFVINNYIMFTVMLFKDVNFALLFTVVYILGYLKMIICCFSSFIFNTLFMTGPIYANTLVSALERTQESDNIEDKTHDCIYSTSKKRFYCCILVLNRRN